MNLSSPRTFRWVMATLGVLAGVLLVTTGHVVVGAVIGGLALVRALFLVAFERRRRRFRGQVAPGGDGAVLRSLARGQFEVAAGAIGASPSEVRIEFARGHSIAEVAAARGVAVESVVDAVVAAAAAKLDRAVAEGRTSRSAADRFKSRLPRWATRLVNGHRPDLRDRAGAFG